MRHQLLLAREFMKCLVACWLQWWRQNLSRPSLSLARSKVNINESRCVRKLYCQFLPCRQGFLFVVLGFFYFWFFCFLCERKRKPLKCIKNSVRSGPINAGKYLNFSLVFSRTGKSLKMVGGPGKSWKSVNSSNKGFLERH